VAPHANTSGRGVSKSGFGQVDHLGLGARRLQPGEMDSSDLEFVIVDGPRPGSWKGAVPEGFRTWVDAWEEFRTEADEYRELDDERVFVLTRFSGRGKTSGLELDELLSKAAHVFHIRDGKVMKVAVYFDRQRAFADLGLPSEASSQPS
jgi:hypothetical protein